MENIVNALARHASACPQAIAFAILNNGEETGQEITYEQLHLRTKALASQLAARKLQGTRVLLAYQDIPEFIVSFLACQYAGIIAVPVSYPKGSRQTSRLSAIIEDAEAVALLCTADSVDTLQQAVPAYIEIIATDDHVQSSFAEPQQVNNETAFIQYTSGSTGKPKGVVVTAKNLLHNQQLLKETFGCNKDSVILSWLPFHHDMGLIGNMLHAVYTGCRCIMMSPLHFMQRPARWLENISKYKVTHSGGPNFAYDLITEKTTADELRQLDLSSWIVAYNGSEPIRFETLQRFAAHCTPAGFRASAFHPCYGLAEATLLVAGNKSDAFPSTIFIEKELQQGRLVIAEPGSQSVPVVSSGAVAQGMDCRIISVRNGYVCSELEEGEICIAGESVTPGYWGRNKEGVFHELEGRSFLRTGDLGFMFKGALYVHGRLKEMLIIRGKNFYPYDIEEVVALSDVSIETNGVAVFSINNPAENFVIVAEIKRNLIRNVQAGEVIDAVEKAVIAAFGIVPYDIILTSPLSIPRTTSGKLQRVQCKDTYAQNAFSVIASKRLLSERLLRKERHQLLLQEVLRNADHSSIKKYLLALIELKAGHAVSAASNDAVELTDLGLDSLRAMELINTINRDLDTSIDASKIFQANTLHGLTQTIENMLWLKTKQPFGREITI